MAVPNSELPKKSPLASFADEFGNRPIPLAAGGNRPQGSGNRPIPVSSNPDEMPLREEPDDEADDDLREILRNAPSWLVSTVFHMALLIVLGLLAASQLKPLTEKVEITASNEPNDAEMMGTQMEDPSVLQGESTHVEGTGPEQLITPRDLPPVDDPFAAPVNIGDIRIPSGVTGPQLASSNVSGAPMVGWALSGRRAGSRNVILGKYGGNATTERGVEFGLEWLAKQQKSDGTWSLVGPYPGGSLSENTAAATAMALLAFQGHGDTHKDGKYKTVVAKGWAALLKMQRKDGLFSGTMTEKNQMLYTHAQCAIAVCELYGMTQDSFYRGPAERAIAYAVSAQCKEYGGWRYEPRIDSDTSVTGWYVMALQSARMAKLEVPDETLELISGYLDKAQLLDGRVYGYWQTANVDDAMTAEGLLCREYLGWHQDDPRLVEGVGALNKRPIEYGTGNQDVYYWYYATQATHHIEGKIWDEWNKVMRAEVPAHQVKSGPEAGSWDPQSDKWGSYGGRLYVTCLSIYMLEVYYRHLPIYSGYTFESGGVRTMDPTAKQKAEAAAAAKQAEPADGKPATAPPKAADPDAGAKPQPATDAPKAGGSKAPDAQATDKPAP